MKHPITLRIDSDLLEASRQYAQQENRTLTNFVETVLRQHIARASAAGARSSESTEQATASATGRSIAKRPTSRKPVDG